MKVKAVSEKILIKIEKKKERVSAGGIVLADSVKEDRMFGVVVSMGKEAFAETKEVKVGDKILVLKYHGDPIEIDGEEHRVVDSETVLAVIEDEKGVL